MESGVAQYGNLAFRQVLHLAEIFAFIDGYDNTHRLDFFFSYKPQASSRARLLPLTKSLFVPLSVAS